jgi:hypothetical protein
LENPMTIHYEGDMPDTALELYREKQEQLA